MHCEAAVAEAVERPGGRRFVFIHPDRFAQVVRAHKERALAIAVFLHQTAVHELSHLDGKMGDGHDEEWVARREDLGAATAHLIPAIAVLVAKLLRLPERETEETRRIARLEKQLAAAREQLAAARQAPKTTPGTRVRWRTLREWLDGWAHIERRPASSARHAALRAHLEALPNDVVEAATAVELEELRRLVNARGVEPPRGMRAGHATTRIKDAIERARQRRRGPDFSERVLDAAVAALRARPPAGIESAYVDGFFARRRVDLLLLVGAAFGGSASGAAG